MPATPLSRIAVERGLPSVQAELGRADQKRLASLPPLIGDDRRIPLSIVLTTLFPEQKRAAALTAFRQFRARLSTAATDAGRDLSLEADTQTRAAPEERWCWFEGADGSTEAAARHTEAETRNVMRIPQEAVRVGKRTARYFISYAHRDEKLKNELHLWLGDLLGSANDYDFKPWQDGDILIGKDWHEEIQAAIRARDFGLLLISPAFLHSTYITSEELQHFVASDPLGPTPNKLAVPVALSAVPFDGSLDLKGLKTRQVFTDSGRKAFEERSGQKTRKDFATQLFSKIIQLLDSHFVSDPPLTGSGPKRLLHDRFREELGRDLGELKFVPSHGQIGTMNKLDEEAPVGERRDAVQFLLDWARERDGPTCCALLGSVGIGKTTTSKAFAHRLLQDREADNSLPMPIYLDLRNLGEATKAEPDLKAILQTLLRRSWQGGETDVQLEADEIIRMVRQEAAIIIFDGLDEVLVHLSQLAGHSRGNCCEFCRQGCCPGDGGPKNPGGRAASS
jgi:TIR domain/NACHT domain